MKKVQKHSDFKKLFIERISEAFLRYPATAPRTRPHPHAARQRPPFPASKFWGHRQDTARRGPGSEEPRAGTPCRTSLPCCPRRAASRDKSGSVKTHDFGCRAAAAYPAPPPYAHPPLTAAVARIEYYYHAASARFRKVACFHILLSFMARRLVVSPRYSPLCPALPHLAGSEAAAGVSGPAT